MRRRLFETSSKSSEEIEKFQQERLSKQLLYISIRAFFQNSYSKLKNWLPCFNFDNFQSAKSSDRFKDIHKPRLRTKFDDNPTSPLKVVPK